MMAVRLATRVRAGSAAVAAGRALHIAAATRPVPITAPAAAAARRAATATPPTARETLAQLVEWLWPDAGLLSIAALTAVATAVVSLATPAAIGGLVNVLAAAVTKSNGAAAATDGSPAAEGALARLWGALSHRDINAAAARLLGLFALNGVLTTVYVGTMSVVGENLAERLRHALFQSYMFQDMFFFDEHKVGELMSRLSDDVQQFKHSVKASLSQGLKAGTQTIGGLVSLYMVSKPLTTVTVLTMPVMYAAGSVYGAYLRRLSERARRADGAASAVASEALGNMRTVRAYAMEVGEVELYREALGRAGAAHRWLGVQIGVFQGLTTLAFSGMFLNVLYLGGSLVASGTLTPGQLMSYLMSTQTTQKSLATLMVLQASINKALAAGTRVYEYIRWEPVVAIRGGDQPATLTGAIEFVDVDFAYPTRPDQQVLRRLSLSIPAGQVVAVCGASGAGKSTIAALLERFYEPTGGAILLDGRPLDTLDPTWLRQHIGYINQDPTLFGTTILDNIRYGSPDVPLERVYEVARLANAHDFITQFPDGYNTVVGERGVTLSGGQRQRIAIARALLKDPRILILDEATSALDKAAGDAAAGESERTVQEALDLLMHGRTVLVIAHRLSTIRKASKIVVMDPALGRPAEEGTHAELLARNGLYARLHAQSTSTGFMT